MTSPTPTRELLPCPCCGSRDQTHGCSNPRTPVWEISCDCGLQMIGNDSESVYSRWNTRPAPSEREGVDIEARAMRSYYVTAHTQGFSNSPLWHELAEGTRDNYRIFVSRALAGREGG